jgi:hypothetical protein
MRRSDLLMSIMDLFEIMEPDGKRLLMIEGEIGSCA